MLICSTSCAPSLLPRWGTPVVFAAVLCLSACSGSAGGGDSVPDGGDSGSGGTSQGGDTFLLYTGSLHAVDPRNPAITFAFESSQVNVYDIEVEGTFQASTLSVQDVRRRRLVYAVGNTVMEVTLKIQRVGETAQAPVPAVLLNSTSPVLELEVEEDFSSPGAASTFVVRRPEGYEVFSENTQGATAVLPFPGTPKETLHDVTTGAFLGWLALDAGMLTRVDRDLNVEVLRTAQDVELLGTVQHSFLRVDNALMHYDPLTRLLTDLAFDTGGQGLYFSSTKGAVLYFALQSANGFEFFRSDADGPVVSLSQHDFAHLDEASLLDTRIVFIQQNSLTFETQLMAIQLDGSAPVTLYSGFEPIDLALETIFSTGDMVYYNRLSQGAVAVKADGTGELIRAGGMWLSPLFSAEIFADEHLEVAHTLLLTGIGQGTAELTVVDRTQLSSDLRSLGQVDSRFSTFFSGPYQSADALAVGFQNDGSIFQSDVFLFDVEVAGSLTQVTDTPTEIEVPIF
ncbi:MAG: hypothetical protein ACI9F9_001305 [Candidatus Paceibacteria bacterium]|jgi:hypothetical protein